MVKTDYEVLRRNSVSPRHFGLNIATSRSVASALEAAALFIQWLVCIAFVIEMDHRGDGVGFHGSISVQ